MTSLGFEDLLRLPAVQLCETTFQVATGVSLKVVPPDAPKERVGFGPGENPFCALVGRTSLGCAACLETQRRAVCDVARQGRLRHLSCFAGLTCVAVPLRIEGRQVATFLSGQVFSRPPTERDFADVLRRLQWQAGVNGEGKLRRAFFATPVISADRFAAAIRLLDVFAKCLVEPAKRQVLSCEDSQPRAVLRAKEFIHAHFQWPLALKHVAQHAHVNPFYLCRLFKQATGMTLTDYVTRLRLEEAKRLLLDPSRRVADVIFAVGFGSVSRFNTVFKQQMGLAPRQYRAQVQAGNHAGLLPGPGPSRKAAPAS
jgi:AraC-like DNA-binding protein/ligand-binding sensor protein